MTEPSTSKGLDHICEILKLIKDWMHDKKISSSNQMIFRGLTSIYDRHYIRSGAAIRLLNHSNYDVNNENNYDVNNESKDYTELKDIDVYPINVNAENEIIESPNLSYSDYISYHEHLIQNAKLTDPDNYKNISDLEILADLQHYGAATCLVDFSRNMLTSLWFACREKSDIIPNPQDEYQGKYGILYCYDTQYDIIDENNLTIVNPNEVDDSISSLLGRTKKITNFCSNSEYTFLLWEPTLLNTRISKQDSVFLFGLSKFRISQHPILSILISDTAKPDIIRALDHVFRINANTIFHDKQGYATINSKFDKLALTHNAPVLFNDIYQRGLDDMFGGNYSIALEFFYDAERKLIEDYVNENQLLDVTSLTGDLTFQIPDKEDAELTLKFAELFLSKAICYKHLVEKDSVTAINYNINSLHEYLKAQLMFKKASDLFKDRKKKEMYFNKYLRTTNDIIQTLYKCKDFESCIEACNSVINIIDNPCNADNHFSSIYCKLANLELTTLLLITSPDAESNYSRFNEFIDTLPKKDELSSNGNNFNRLLISFFKYFTELYITGIYDKSFKHVRTGNVIDFENELRVLYTMPPIRYIIDYSTWDFTELKEIIEDPTFKNKNKNVLQRILATVISARDYYRILCLNHNECV